MTVCDPGLQIEQPYVIRYSTNAASYLSLDKGGSSTGCHYRTGQLPHSDMQHGPTADSLNEFLVAGQRMAFSMDGHLLLLHAVRAIAG